MTSGLVAAYWLTRSMAGLLVGVSSVDVLTYAVVSAGLMAITLTASYMPARRPARGDPIDALRME